MKDAKREVSQHANFLSLLRSNVHRDTLLVRSYNFNVISRFAGKFRFVEAVNEEGSVGVSI
jgi:hypothetical protein